MLKKVLCGTMAIGLAALLSLPELAVAFPQKSTRTSIQQNQLELVKVKRKKKSKKKIRRGRPVRRLAQFQQQPLHQVQQQYLA